MDNVKILPLLENDVIIYKAKGKLSPRQIKEIYDSLLTVFPENEIAVIPEGDEIEIIRQEEK
jgi:hypothetical protein